MSIFYYIIGEQPSKSYLKARLMYQISSPHYAFVTTFI
jgi:hypothetical protein